jgi:hypothetical protein
MSELQEGCKETLQPAVLLALFLVSQLRIVFEDMLAVWLGFLLSSSKYLAGNICHMAFNLVLNFGKCKLVHSSSASKGLPAG